MQRGDVHLITVTLPSRPSGQGGTRAKHLVVLQGGPEFANTLDVAVVLCSTRRTTRPPRAFEVLAGPREGFTEETLIDCRWPLTVPKTDFNRSNFTLHLDHRVMELVSEALTVGLQM